MQSSEAKLKRKFKAESKKYKSWCLKRGYKSGETLTLLWYFRRKGKAVKDNGWYEVIIKEKRYKPEAIIEFFKNDKNNNK